MYGDGSRRIIMIKLLTLSLAFALTASMGCANDVAVDSTTTIRVLSYNIHHGEGMDGRLDLERIAKVIESVSPDIVSLQEVDNKTRRTDGIDQARELARLTHMQSIFGASMKYDGGQYGNAVLTTLKIKESKVIPLPGEPRSALCVKLELPSQKLSANEFIFIATHLQSRKDGLTSVALIEEGFKPYHGLPAVLAGDLNAIPGSPTMLAFEKTWRNTVDRKSFFTSNNTGRQIDYILCRPRGAWDVIHTEVLDEKIASDHRPVLAVLKFNPTYSSRENGKSPGKPDADDSK